jgi:hypothetical protein
MGGVFVGWVHFRAGWCIHVCLVVELAFLIGVDLVLVFCLVVLRFALLAAAWTVRF